MMIHMGRVLVAREKRSEATDWFVGAIYVDELCHRGYAELSFLHAENAELQHATELLRQAVTLRPLFPDYRYYLGTLLMDMQHVDQAITELQRVLTINPEYGHAALHLAAAHIDRDSIDKALDLLAGGSWANWPEALVLAAEAHLKREQTSTARRLFEQALVIDESNIEAQEGLRALEETAV